MKAKQFLVVGLGRFGMSVARSLSDLGQEVMAVDTDAALVDTMAPHVMQAIQLDVTDEEALSSLDIQNFDVAIVSIGQNTRDSILVSVLLKELGVPYLVARVNDELHAKVLRKVGVDRVIFPEQDMGARLARSLLTPNVLELMELTGDYQIVETRVPAKWVGHSMLDLDVRRRYGLTILAILRGGRFLVSPAPDIPFETNDNVLVMGRKDDIERLES